MNEKKQSAAALKRKLLAFLRRKQAAPALLPAYSNLYEPPFTPPYPPKKP